MKKGNRISANYVRKFIPNLRRINTDQGRKWTINGEDRYDDLQGVIDASIKASKQVDEVTQGTPNNLTVENGEPIQEEASDAAAE